MATETRTRITVLLPAPKTLAQYLLVDKVLTDLVLVCGGVTFSNDIPPVFFGRWKDDSQKTIQDDILFIVGDIFVNIRYSQNLIDYLERLKLRAQQDFNQDIIWITINEVFRVSTHDNSK
jgi:hypothetical protein